MILAEKEIYERNMYDERPYYRKKESYKPNYKKKTKPQKKGRYIVFLAIIALLSVFLLARFSAITVRQYRLEKIKAEVKNINSQNERLKVEVANLKSVARIEDIAKNKLNMIEPENVQIVYLNNN
ncbi:MAG TPA: hypothetical protein GX534_08420 [Thermoanaerobacterales bacterium]|nr:hypothetical protein [Thermoanaerobacterales bacterium]